MSQSSNEKGKQTTEFVKRFVRACEVRITIAFLSLARHPSRVTYSFLSSHETRVSCRDKNRVSRDDGNLLLSGTVERFLYSSF